MRATHSIFEVFSDEHAAGVVYKNKALKKAIVNYLDTHDNATIAELTHVLNTSAPKTTSLISELIQDGLIRDYGKIDSTGGRRANGYGMVAESCFFLGVDIKRYGINIGLLDFRKNLVAEKMQIPFILENTKDSLAELIRIIQSYIGELPVDRQQILSACLNLSGRVNTRNGYSYSFFHFQEEPLSAVIGKAIGIRTFLENDSRAMAYGEFHNGIVNGEKNVLFVNLDYGIGLGILIDGKVYYGRSGFSGELGHIPLFNNELICHCGKKGCLETEASGQALIRLVKERIRQGVGTSLSKIADRSLDELRLSDIIEAARNEDTLAIELLAEIGGKLGRGMAVLINIYNPELVILGGILASTGDYVRLAIKSALNKYSLTLVNSDTQLRISKLGERAGVIGGCLIARSKLLSTL
jgi:predicted NBD/HSP70 family sugar kinase